MKKKINLNLIVTAIFTAIITMICMNVIYFYLFDKQVKKDLRNTAQTLQETGAFNKSAKIPDISVENMRITWIDTDGTVLYDNENDETILENHLNRPEVKEAI